MESIDHRPETAVALSQPLWIEAKAPISDEVNAVSGFAIAIGWDRPQGTTCYLVSDDRLQRPVWVPEDAVQRSSIRPLR